MRASRRWLPILVLALIPLLPLWRAVFLGEAIGPFDQIRQMAPWNGPKPDQPWDVLQADGVLQFYPWRDLVLTSWGQGRIPFWNPYELAGTPLLANSQSGALYPPHILLGLLHVPTPLAMALLAWLHLFLASAGVYVLARRLGADWTGGLVAGASFGLSAFMLAWTALPSVITTVAWIPWMLVAVRAVGRGGGLKSVAGLAGATAMLLLAGHLQFCAYGFFAAVLMGLGYAFAGFRRKEGKAAGLWILAGLILGAAISAPHLMPVLSYSQFSHRRNTPTAEGYQAYVGSALKPFELGTAPFATLEGDPRQWSPSEEAKLPSYWPPFVKQGANFAESAISLGPLVLSLLFLAPWRRRELWPVAAIGVLALLLALGTALNAALYYGVPGWSSTGSPGRIGVLFVMAACVVAGVAVSQASLERLAKPRRILALLLPILLLIPFVALIKTARPPEGVDPASLDAVANGSLTQAAPGLLIAVLASVAAIGCLFRRDRPAARAVVAAVPVVIALAAGGLTLVPTGAPLAKAAPPADGSARVAVVNEAWGLGAAAPALLPPNTASLSGIHELGGYDSLLHRDTVALLHDVDGQDSAPPANGNMMFVKPSADPRKLAEAGVTEVWSTKPLPGLSATPADGGYFRQALPGPGRASTPAGPAKIESETLSQIRLQATGPGRLVLRDRMMPGWIAKVDGRHVPLEGKTWRELDLPPGEHTVEMNYVAPGFTAGAGIGFLALVATAILAVLGAKRHPKAPTNVLNE